MDSDDTGIPRKSEQAVNFQAGNDSAEFIRELLTLVFGHFCWLGEAYLHDQGNVFYSTWAGD